MGTLRDLAQRALRDVEHQLEHDVERLEHRREPFQARSAKPGAVEHWFPQQTARNGTCSNVPVPIAWNAGTPAEVGERLSRMPCSSRINPHNWRKVVIDCQRLASEGWALQALNLGWSLLDLYGAVTDPADDPEADGLAVKLGGRKVLAISNKFATVENGPNARGFIYRRGSEGARLLWELGHGS